MENLIYKKNVGLIPREDIEALRRVSALAEQYLLTPDNTRINYIYLFFVLAFNSLVMKIGLPELVIKYQVEIGFILGSDSPKSPTAQHFEDFVCKGLEVL